MSVADELEKLHALRQSGAISEEEYSKAKEAVLQKEPSVGAAQPVSTSERTLDVNTWAMFIHLSQLCGFVLPLAGFVVPIILWQIKKKDSPILDQHGKIAVNWMISALLYGVGGILLMAIGIGIPLLTALGVASIVLPIVGGVKANNGEIWPYPLSIKFLS